MAFRRVETNQKRDLALNLCGRLGELPNESIEKAREIAAEILFLLPDKKFRKKRFAIRLFSSGIVAKRSLKFGNWGHCSGFKFYYAQTDEVTGRGAGELSEEVLNELKRFACGDLSREELERFCAKIVSNTLAIETLAREIKLHWDRYHPTS